MFNTKFNRWSKDWREHGALRFLCSFFSSHLDFLLLLINSMLTNHAFKLLNLYEPILWTVKSCGDLFELFLGEFLFCSESTEEIIDQLLKLKSSKLVISRSSTVVFDEFPEFYFEFKNFIAFDWAHQNSGRLI